MFTFGRHRTIPEVVDLTDQIEALKAELASLEGRKSLEDQLDTLEAKVNDTEQELRKAKVNLVTATESKLRVERAAQGSIAKLNRQIEDLKSEHKRADEDIKHMIKLNDEANEMKNEQYKFSQEKKTAAAISTVKDEYRDAMEKVLQQQIVDGKEMVSVVLAQLPQTSMKIKASV